MIYPVIYALCGVTLLWQLCSCGISLVLLPFTYLIDILDKKYRIRDDFYIIPYFITSVLGYIWRLQTNRFQNWYIFEQKVRKHGSLPCIIYPRPLKTKGEFEVESYSYKGTYDIVLRLTHILYNEYGIRAGDYIALDCTNKPLFIFLWLSLWNIGAIPAFLNYNQLGKPLVHSIVTSNVKQVLIDPQASQAIKATEEELLKEVPDIQLRYLDEDQLLRLITSTSSPSLRINDDERSHKTLKDFEPALLIFTSGTTGLPKPAIMSWRKSTIGCALFGHVMRIRTDSIILTAMPLYHSTAALLGACAVFSQGGCVAISNKFSASSFWKEAYLTRTTHIQYVGEVCRYLLNSPKSEYENKCRVRVAYGNGLRPGIWMDFKNRFYIDVIGEFYASTEAPFATTSFQRGTFGVGACRNYGALINWILSYQQTLVRMEPDDDSTVYRNRSGFCEVSKVGEPGELMMRIFKPRKPETSFQGYVGNKTATQSKVLRDVFRKGDAWYRSGDLLKADEDGLWYFVDRLGDTFRWKSENVSATEVENQMMRYNKEIFECVVILGIKIPNHEGKAGFAVVQLKNEYLMEDKIHLLNGVLDHLKMNLPKYSLPILVKFVDEIEVSHNHKLAKRKYKEQKLPHGEEGNETIYWLKNYSEYSLLTDEDWSLILSGKSRL
ncbi:long-chain fatty acid transporter FAT1 Ecym_4504 [Eremothecium cymbalariae DBVPG|uniref:Very long-chain fatty acid transport protein n=1 Tax=Eremothecium cymbalariae (strain CBS 270.75 / DBVPG 7215 / KCTC 17166 / NRRL Y-17582) TaxID=931890 RepID=G8JU38_ERECY|nr:hypothetical protein Ecym_4504 [Eremothecium cymbalariae DBVPG\